MTLTFARDLYGGAARVTLIADFVEACAWQRGRFPHDEMESFLRHIGRARFGDAFVLDNDDTAESATDPSASDLLGEPSDDPQRLVVATLKERQRVLGPLYPFDVDDKELRWRRPPDGAYDSLLAITLAHAFDIGPSTSLSTTTVEALFEVVTARCMERCGWKVFDMGKGGRHASTFPAALEAASAALGWPLHATPPYSRSAQEEGCDTLVMMPWRDERPGRLFLVGQATIARSEEWKKKISEPSPAKWGERLQLDGKPGPIPFLAIPHHAEFGVLRDVQKHAGGIVVDRLRLAIGPSAGRLSPDERTIIDSVRSAGVEL